MKKKVYRKQAPRTAPTPTRGAYYVIDEGIEVFSSNDIYVALTFLRRKCGPKGQLFRTEDDALLAFLRVPAEASTPMFVRTWNT